MTPVSWQLMFGPASSNWRAAAFCGAFSGISTNWMPAAGGSLRQLFADHTGRRIITASFASHIHRIQQICDAAIANGRVVATMGLSMRKNVRLGLELGVLRIPEGSLIDIENKYLEGSFDVVTGDIERLAGRKPRALRDVLLERLT